MDNISLETLFCWLSADIDRFKIEVQVEASTAHVHY